MVHVKKVEIFGFKSFGFTNTTVGFEPGLVSISGPNGSGKSNILDAIIFAMGENKPKVLRVDKLKSLIHDVDGSRRGPKMARSSVHFDNSDRKIPVDSDSVEITRELTSAGENTYYINRKKTNRSHVIDLMDMANAGLGQLNAVQQGTVTRISEFTPEEKRQAIEDLVGLTYFDEKKEEAVKQLEAADTKLQVAMAKMGEIKNSIDRLEAERNQKLRHDLLSRELGRYRAMDAARKLGGVLDEKRSKEALLKEAQGGAAKAGAELEVLRDRLGKLEKEMAAMLDGQKRHSDEKKALDVELSSVRRRYEADEASIITSRREAERLEAGIPGMRAEAEELRAGQGGAASKLREAQDVVDAIDAKREELESEARKVDAQRRAALESQARAAAARSEADSRIKQIESKIGRAEVDLSTARRKKEESEQRARAMSARLAETDRGIEQLKDLRSKLDAMAANSGASISELHGRIARLRRKKAKAEGDLAELEAIRDKSSKAADQYESRIKTIKGLMHEDYTAARLMADAERLGILGMAYQMLTWGKEHERAVLAVSSDWLKAMVVPDFATLAGIAGAARERRLPKLKIIPLDALPDLRHKAPRMRGVTGMLSDHVGCRPGYEALRAFLFGGTVLAQDAESARRASQAGYKAVTPAGEYFEARGGSVVIDIDSKISKITRLISMSGDIDGLFKSISAVKKYMARKRRAIREVEAEIEAHRSRVTMSEKMLTSKTENRDAVDKKLESAALVRESMQSRIRGFEEAAGSAARDAESAESAMAGLRAELGAIDDGQASGEQDRIAAELERVNLIKADLESRHTEMLSEQREGAASMAAARAEGMARDSRVRSLEAEVTSAEAEIPVLRGRADDLEKRTAEARRALSALRDREQELLSRSGYSVERFEEVNGELGGLREQERTLSRREATLERQSDSLGRDVDDLRREEAALKGVLGSFGFGPGDISHDVSAVISGLQSELDSLGSLNAKAPGTYLEISDGYRSMSARKNDLEGERTKIVRFIEGVEKDKKQTFLDAFDTVDGEIRAIFGKMTGGEAWLEIQDEDDVFGSGLSYLIQFPSKPKRESTSISGGEKTLAAVVFVLALQRLKPSPFYLFDEVDAHLDAPNSEKLAKILDERSQESQFLMVSLKESVIQKARLIYGVYPDKGSSKVVVFKDKRMALKASRG